MDTVIMKVKNYVEMLNPYSNNTTPQKVRFYALLSDVPELITDWMTTNPREQNLTSSVAKAIAASIEQDSMDFHLKNRGILLSVKETKFTPDQPNSKNGEVSLSFEDSNIHGNIDGGHTLRLILASHNKKGYRARYNQKGYMNFTYSIEAIFNTGTEAFSNYMSLDESGVLIPKFHWVVFRDTNSQLILCEDYMIRADKQINSKPVECKSRDIEILNFETDLPLSSLHDRFWFNPAVATGSTAPGAS